MKLMLEKDCYIETSRGIDISLTLINNSTNPTAWYVGPPEFNPVETENYVGSVQKGGSVNFRDIFFNPHGHGTHTECLGHITEEVYSVNDVLKDYFFEAKLISIEPARIQNRGVEDSVIQLDQIKAHGKLSEALVIRTLPNSDVKLTAQYSNTNPPYIDAECAQYLIDNGVKHLLIDTPSVDREEDDGILAFHHAFWEVPQKPNFERTITELVYVPNAVKDGDYILELQMAAFANDAAPSRPVLYEKVKA